MKEVYKTIPGFPDYYEISNLGNIRSLDSVVTINKQVSYTIKGKQLKPTLDCNDYFRITIKVDGKYKNCKIHRLVAMAFISNQHNKPCVDHIDGDRHNNKSSNLRWVTYKENSNNPITVARLLRAKNINPDISRPG